jgi:hypothetical protein
VNYRKVLIVDVPVDVDEPAFAAAWNLVDAAGREKLQEADLVVVTQGHQSYVMLAASLERARRRVPRGLVCIPRQPGDDRTIVEVWT